VRAASSKSATPESRPSVERSIAVLPFLNLSSDPENEYFSDGITEEILNALVKVSDLKVASRTSSFSFKGHQGDVREIAEKLGVATVLEGSVRKAGERVRVTSQLIGALDGYHLWSETYDRKLEDIFAIQDDIAHSIVTALKATLAVDEGEKLVTATTDNVEAYTLYLKGRFEFNKFTEAGLRRSLELYEEALEKGPDYAKAYAGIADSWMNLADDWVAPETAYVAGKEAAARALELDPDLAEANTALGKVYCWYDWEFTRGELALRRAVASNPNYTDAHWALGTLLPAVGRLDEGIREMRTAQKLDPLSPTFSQWIARFLLYQRRPADSIEESLRTLELDPEYARGHMTLGLARMLEEGPGAGLASLRRSAEVSWSPSFRAFLAYGLAAAGQEAEARRVLEELQSEGQDSYVRAEFLAAAHGMLGDRDEAFRQLDRALEQRSAGMIYLHLDPLYDSIRNDPRFTSLVETIGLQ
jgi:serine/threonine-protein kinase